MKAAHTLRAACLAATLLMLAAPASAQTADMDRADWAEDTPPPPPKYDVNHLINIEMPRASTVQMGVDPDSIQINIQTGVVRYVVVARGQAAVNASYEGIRCATGEYRVYARQVQGGPWVDASESGWKPMRGQTNTLTRYPHDLARDGMCIGTAVRPSVREIVRELKTGNRSLYY